MMIGGNKACRLLERGPDERKVHECLSDSPPGTRVECGAEKRLSGAVTTEADGGHEGKNRTELPLGELGSLTAVQRKESHCAALRTHAVRHLAVIRRGPRG